MKWVADLRHLSKTRTRVGLPDTYSSDPGVILLVGFVDPCWVVSPPDLCYRNSTTTHEGAKWKRADTDASLYSDDLSSLMRMVVLTTGGSS